jgi:hypothetical protein
LTEDKPLFAFADKLKAERENEPLTGIEWLNAAAILRQFLAGQFLSNIAEAPNPSESSCAASMWEMTC